MHQVGSIPGIQPAEKYPVQVVAGIPQQAGIVLDAIDIHRRRSSRWQGHGIAVDGPDPGPGPGVAAGRLDAIAVIVEFQVVLDGHQVI